MRFTDKYAQRDKRLLRLERELNRLHRAQGDAPIVPLEHPYQRGWEKSFVLREDALHHPEAAVFSAVLAVVNQRVLSRNREFVSRHGHPIVLRPRIIPVGEWARRPWPFTHQRLFAYGRWQTDRFYSWSTHRYCEVEVGFKLFRTWWLEERLQPHMITHQRVELPEVRSRIAEIEAYLEANLGRCRLDWLHGRSRWWRRIGPASVTEQRAAAALVDQGE
jgi:hypothetical protein